MIVFKTFLRVLNKCKMPVIMFTVILVCFAGFNMKTSDNSMSFVASKPDVLIVNRDENVGITKNLIEYLERNCELIDVDRSQEAIDDALFYRDVNYVVYIPENYRRDFLDGKSPQLEVKSTGDYQASLAEMMVERYLKVANVYNGTLESEDDIIFGVNDTLSNETEVLVTSKLDTDALEKASFYYNFMNYSILAGCVYVICLILSSFKEEKVRKRTVVSSTDYGRYNFKLLFSNCLFAIVLWAVYVGLSFVLVGNVMFSMHGLMYVVNSFVFTLCAVTIAFLIGSLVMDKNAINGIVNVVALGSSFLCGAFVPMEWLPDFVIKIAHVLPSYYYISANDMIGSIESFSFETMSHVVLNMAVVLIFSVGFVVITNVVSKRKRRIG